MKNKKKGAKAFVIILLLIYLFLLFIRYMYPPYYNKSVNTFVIIMEVSMF